MTELGLKQAVFKRLSTLKIFRLSKASTGYFGPITAQPIFS